MKCLWTCSYKFSIRLDSNINNSIWALASRLVDYTGHLQRRHMSTDSTGIVISVVLFSKLRSEENSLLISLFPPQVFKEEDVLLGFF